jgi:hypothetical protein
MDFAPPDAHGNAINRNEPVELLDQTVRLKDYVLCRHRT